MRSLLVEVGHLRTIAFPSQFNLPSPRCSLVAKRAASCSSDHEQDVSEGKHMIHDVRFMIQHSRRAAVGLLVSGGLSAVAIDGAYAISPGFPALKEWLKGQKQRTSKFLLAPIGASRERLNTAHLLLNAEDLTSDNYEEAGRLVKVAARDCMPAESGSIIDFQTRTGVEVCTFRLVVKNAASLLDKTDPVKQKADEGLDDLIRSFINLDKLLSMGAAGSSPNREKLEDALEKTSVALDHFEGAVRDCLGIA